MDAVALVGLFNAHGWLLLQERDEHAPVDPNKWGLVGGGVEADEVPLDAARRELAEETGVDCDHLAAIGSYLLPCTFHGQDRVELFTARMPLTDADIDCREGRQIVFVDPDAVADLDLTEMSRALLHEVLTARTA